MKKIFGVMLVMALMLSFVSCTAGNLSASSGGGSGNTSGDKSSVDSSAQDKGSSDDEAGLSETPTIDEIKESGKLVMVTNATFPPYEYFKDNEIQGIDAELAGLIAQELGVELEIMDMNFDLLIDAINNKRANIVAAGMSITDERKQAVDFSIPYIDTQLVIIVKQGSEIKAKEDIEGKKVSVQESTTSDLYLTDTDEVTPAEILRFKSAVEAGNALSVDKCEAVVMDKPTALNIVNAAEGLVILDETISEEQYAMAIPKGQEDLLEVVDRVLKGAVSGGKVEELVAYHMENYK